MKYQEIILPLAAQQGIEVGWVNAIITQESNWNPFALRYEPNYRYIFSAESFAKKLGISVETETQTQKFSWGLGQLMGGLARELGHTLPMGNLFDPSMNIFYIIKRLGQLKKVSAVPDDVFAGYNGGLGSLNKVNGRYPNQSYVDSVKNHLQSQLN